jgi:hypothetical protein
MHPRRHAREQARGDRHHQEDGDRDRQVPQPGLQRRVPQVALQVQGHVEEQREHRARDRERGELHAGERAAPEQLERQHRLAHAPLDGDEREQQEGRTAQQRDDQRAAPPFLVAAQQRQHEQQQRAAERHDAGPVDARRVRVARLAQRELGGGERRGPDRDVDEEHPLPAEPVGEHAADERPDGDGHADRGAVGAHRGAALATGGELLRDQGERDREHDRAADALHGTGQVEERRIGREPGQQRRDGEHDEADREHAPAPEPVGERPGGEHERGERQRVGVDDPLQVGEARAEVVADRRQRRVDHGDVEQEHEHRDADRQQRPPPAGVCSHAEPSP